MPGASFTRKLLRTILLCRYYDCHICKFVVLFSTIKHPRRRRTQVITSSARPLATDKNYCLLTNHRQPLNRAVMFQFGVGDEDKDLIAVFVVSNDEDESAQMELQAKMNQVTFNYYLRALSSFFKKCANPGLFFHLLPSFQTQITIFTTNNCEKMS